MPIQDLALWGPDHSFIHWFLGTTLITTKIVTTVQPFEHVTGNQKVLHSSTDTNLLCGLWQITLPFASSVKYQYELVLTSFPYKDVVRINKCLYSIYYLMFAGYFKIITFVKYFHLFCIFYYYSTYKSKENKLRMLELGQKGLRIRFQTILWDLALSLMWLLWRIQS